MKKWLPSLITRTPQEGYELAIRLATKGIELIQPNEKIRKKIRPKYSTNPDNIIAADQVIAIHFQTIAAANNYWRSPSRNTSSYNTK